MSENTPWSFLLALEEKAALKIFCVCIFNNYQMSKSSGIIIRSSVVLKKSVSVELSV